MAVDDAPNRRSPHSRSSGRGAAGASAAPAGPEADAAGADDPALAALARVRRGAGGGESGSAVGRAGRGGRPRAVAPRFSGSGPDRRDPQLLGASLTSWATESGHVEALTVAGLTSRWADIVGAEMAAHVRVLDYEPRDGLLTLAADSPLWEANTGYYVETIKDRVSRELGARLVSTIVVRRPGARSRTGRHSGRRRRR